MSEDACGDILFGCNKQRLPGDQSVELTMLVNQRGQVVVLHTFILNTPETETD